MIWIIAFWIDIGVIFSVAVLSPYNSKLGALLVVLGFIVAYICLVNVPGPYHVFPWN